MEASTAVGGANGTVPATARDRIAHDLETEIVQLQERREQLEAELATVSSDIKAFEQSLLRLRGEPLIKTTRGSGRPRGGRMTTATGASTSRVGPEVLAEIEAAIRAYAVDHDEFRQVDVRGTMTGTMANSSKMATAFEQLRQEGVIRLARRDGINKYFRLTETARRTKLVSDERVAEIEQTVRELAADGGEIDYVKLMNAGGMSHSTASYAMTELEERGVVVSRRSGGAGGGVKLFRLADKPDEAAS
jgi:DNA-binding transcriptional ArsR family regulator